MLGSTSATFPVKYYGSACVSACGQQHSAPATVWRPKCRNGKLRGENVSLWAHLGGDLTTFMPTNGGVNYTASLIVLREYY